MSIEARKRLRMTGLLVGLLLTLFSLFVYVGQIPFFQMVELKAYDLHFLSRGIKTPGPEVAIVAIDEKSLDELGRWPWPRARMAELVESLTDLKAGAVAFDIIFAEPDLSSGLSVIRELKKSFEEKDPKTAAILEKLEEGADNDHLLAEAIKGNRSVILGYFFHMSSEEAGIDAGGGIDAISASRFSLVRSIDGSDFKPRIHSAAAFEGNIDKLAIVAKSFGYFNVIPDIDGSIRWAPLVFEYRGAYYPHLSLEAVRKYAGSVPLMLNVAEYGVDSIMVGRKKVLSDERARVLINYRGPAKTFPHYSFVDVIKGRVPPEALAGKIVLVGATAVGIYDMRVTPFGTTFPGVEINANIIDNILAGDFIQRPGWVTYFDILAILLLGLLLTIIIPRVRALYSLIVSLVLIVGYAALNAYVFASMNVWVSFIYPFITIIVVSAGVTVFQYMTEEKKKRELRDAFSRYVAPSLVDEIAKRPDLLELGGEEKRLTVLFSDIRGFTSVSEGLEPRQLVKLMNDYLTPMTDIVINSGGTVDKYMGDAIMAFWGAPMDDPKHALRACQAAFEMIETLPKLHKVWEQHGIKKFDIGIGLSTGIVTVGNMGSSMRFDYTVIGDSINLGARLEGLTKEYGAKIIVTKYTYEDVKEEMILRELDMVKVKGKELHIKIYELMGALDPDGKLKELKDTFEKGLSCYRAQDWNGAEGYFEACQRIEPTDGPAAVFLGRLGSLRIAKLPEVWDGIYVMKTK